MAEQIVSGAQDKLIIDPLGWRGTLHEVIKAFAAAVGLSLLWGLENMRNAFFRQLDRMNLKPWARKGSAFPPGRPRKLKD